MSSQVGGPFYCAIAGDAAERSHGRLHCRVKALDERNLVAVVTYMLARYPDTFPAMLDDALSTLSPKADR